MTAPKLTIGQLAAHVGVTTRAVRFYHARGLLPEPARDDSGYRRYDARAVVDLIKIKTLADAGVPLARISELLQAIPQEFANAVASIDDGLQEKIKEIEEHRRRLGKLTQGEQLFLPREIVDLLDELRAIGVSERAVVVERDLWIVAAAISPKSALLWAEQKKAALSHPEFRAVYLLCDEAFEWDPADARLVQLTDRIARWSADHPHATVVDEEATGLSILTELMAGDVNKTSPAWEQLGHREPPQPPGS